MQLKLGIALGSGSARGWSHIGVLKALAERIGQWLNASRGDNGEDDVPGILDVVGASINIMQDRITRSRMVGEPPEVTIAPHLEDFQLMDFHRANAAIAASKVSIAEPKSLILSLNLFISLSPRFSLIKKIKSCKH